MINKHAPYSVADIQRYVRGGMSNSEMRQLELAALSDPFLQDAIDGFKEAYANYPANEIETALHAAESFTTAIKEEKEEAVVIPIWRRKLVQYAVAASVVLGTGWYIFNLSRPQSKLVNNEATHDVMARTTDTIAPNKPANATIPEYKLKEPQQVATTTNKQVATNTNKAEDNAVKTIEVPPAILDDTDAKTENTVAKKNEEITLNEYDSVRDVVITAPAAPAKSSAFAQKPAAESLQGKVAGLEVSSNLISGKITDTDKYPLDNITLQVKGSKRAVLSDELGRFQIVIPDSTATLVASGMGYKSKEFKASTGGGHKIELQLEPAAPSLSEVVVSGYGSRKKNTVNEIDTTEAVPTDGWEKFETYILKNKNIRNTGKTPISVVLTFEVDENGRRDEFDIVRSGGLTFDNEAIRLVKDGPKWKNKTSDSTAMAKITIVF